MGAGVHDDMISVLEKCITGCEREQLQRIWCSVSSSPTELLVTGIRFREGGSELHNWTEGHTWSQVDKSRFNRDFQLTAHWGEYL